ncbi:hypothetical protein Pla52nx_000321 [Stieleria varia]
MPANQNDAQSKAQANAQTDGSTRPVGHLASQLSDLRVELARLAELLAEQSATRKRRRRITIRGLMLAAVGFGLLFAYYSHLYRNSLDQSRLADQLSAQAAFISYEPRKSLLLSLLPGDIASPPAAMAQWLGQDFFTEITNVSTNAPTASPRDPAAVIQAVAGLPSIKRLRLTGLTVSTLQLDSLDRLNQLESLDLTRTVLDYGSMPWLRNARLKWFSAAHTRFSDPALADLCQCTQLRHIDLERTAVTDKGIQLLSQLPNLRYVKLHRTPTTKSEVLKLSKAMPNCVIDWEPLVMNANGQINGGATRRGRIRLGTALPADPRPTHQAVPPIDQNQNVIAWPYLQSYSPYVNNSGYSNTWSPPIQVFRSP